MRDGGIRRTFCGNRPWLHPTRVPPNGRAQRLRSGAAGARSGPDVTCNAMLDDNLLPDLVLDMTGTFLQPSGGIWSGVEAACYLAFDEGD